MIVAIWAEEGKGKTTVALSFPRPLVHFDLDVGGFERAAWRLDTTDIRSKSYPLPIQVEKLTGAKPDGVTVHFPKRVIGYRETWEQIIVDYIAACQDPEVKTIVFDSGTQLWTICHRAELQIKQEIQLARNPNLPEKELRERLQPVEFPNERIREIIYAARSFGKNLVLTHYPKEVYGERWDSKGELIQYKTGEIDLDGFKDTTKLVDVVIKLDMNKDNTITATIVKKCGLEGLGMKALGLTLPEPSYEGILQLQKAMKGE
jgi:hypothetical protein